MDAWGLRKAADPDIVVTPELHQKLKEKGWEERQAHGFPMLVKDDANVTTVQDKPTDGDYNPDRLQLIKEVIKIKKGSFREGRRSDCLQKSLQPPQRLAGY